MPRAEHFVSYTHCDRDWAEWVAWTLEELGTTVRIQAWDFAPGSTWPQEMHLAIKECKRIVCIVSPDFLTSAYATAEWQPFFVDDPLGKGERILPVRVRECEPDGLLKGRVFVDLVGKDRAEARSAIARLLQRRRGKPKNEPRFPGGNRLEPEFPGLRCFTLVLDGEFDEAKRSRVEALLDHLRKLLDEPNITIAAVQPGSVIVTLLCPANAARRFEQLMANEERPQLAGSTVLGFWETTGRRTDPIAERVRALETWLPLVFEGRVDADEARDLTQELMAQVLATPGLIYPVLESPARAAQLALSLVALREAERARDREVRSRMRHGRGTMARTRILEATAAAYDALGPGDKGMLEEYWGSLFSGSPAADLLRTKVHALRTRIEASVMISAE